MVFQQRDDCAILREADIGDKAVFDLILKKCTSTLEAMRLNKLFVMFQKKGRVKETEKREGERKRELIPCVPRTSIAVALLSPGL